MPERDQHRLRGELDGALPLDGDRTSVGSPITEAVGDVPGIDGNPFVRRARRDRGRRERLVVRRQRACVRRGVHERDRVTERHRQPRRLGA